jgi:hypothetical protein
MSEKMEHSEFSKKKAGSVLPAVSALGGRRLAVFLQKKL